jgi:hypothetical protein
MQEYVAIEVARIRRVVAGEKAPDLSHLKANSEYVRMLMAPESSDAANAPTMTPYVSLLRGELDKALAAEKKSKDERARVVRLVAASDGASREMIDAALALPPEAGLDPDTFLPTLSLATRMGRDVSPLLPLAPKLYPLDADKLMNAFGAIRSHADRTVVEKAMRGLDPRSRGYVYVAAAMLGGAEYPSEWRAAARQLLFASERPFLR